MQKLGPNGDGKSAVVTPDGKSRKKKICIASRCIVLKCTLYSLGYDKSLLIQSIARNSYVT